MLATLGILMFLGYTLNSMVIIGMVLALGMLLDVFILVMEGMHDGLYSKKLYFAAAALRTVKPALFRPDPLAGRGRHRRQIHSPAAGHHHCLTGGQLRDRLFDLCALIPACSQAVTNSQGNPSRAVVSAVG